MKTMANNKITLLSAMLIFLTALYPPNVRYFLNESVLSANQAAWLSCLASLVVFIPLLYVLYRVMKAFEGQSLVQIMCRVFGGFLGKTIAFILLLWLFILLSMYIKYSGETLVTTVYVGTDIRFIIFLAVILTAVVLRFGLPVLSRMIAILFTVGALQFLIIAVLLFIEFDPRNVTPVSTADIGPIASSIVYALTIYVYITFFFIFNDQIQLGKKAGGKFVFTAAFLTGVSTIMVLAVLGVFGAGLINKLKFPFHSAVENISVLGGNTGIESLFISLWMMFEFILICSFTYMVVRLLRDIFGLKRQVPLLTAVIMFAYIFAIYICSDVFELIAFSNTLYLGSTFRWASAFLLRYSSPPKCGRCCHRSPGGSANGGPNSLWCNREVVCTGGNNVV